MPFMGKVPVSRQPGVRELWDNATLPPGQEVGVGANNLRASNVLPMGHQGRRSVEGSYRTMTQPELHWQKLRQYTKFVASVGGFKKMDIPHDVSRHTLSSL